MILTQDEAQVLVIIGRVSQVMRKQHLALDQIRLDDLTDCCRRVGQRVARRGFNRYGDQPQIALSQRVAQKEIACNHNNIGLDGLILDNRGLLPALKALDKHVAGKDTNGSLAVFEYTGTEMGGPPLHLHLKQDEIFFIVQGEYTFQVGDDKYELKAGDTIFLPRKVPHTFAQTSPTGKMFFMFQPSGKMEDFFRTIGNLKEPPTPEQGAKIFADHDMKVVGPPLAL